jgi:hypothetical protein
MKIEVTCPFLVNAVPAGRKARHAIWGRTWLAVDLSGQGGDDAAELHCRYSDVNGLTNEVWRIGEGLYRHAGVSDLTPETARDAIESLLAKAAADWSVERFGGIKAFPPGVDGNRLRMDHHTLLRALPDLAEASDLTYSDPIEWQADEFQKFIRARAASFAVVDGELLERTPEPFLHVRGYASACVVTVSDTWLPALSPLAAFPLDDFEAASRFAAAVAERSGGAVINQGEVIVAPPSGGGARMLQMTLASAVRSALASFERRMLPSDPRAAEQAARTLAYGLPLADIELARDLNRMVPTDGGEEFDCEEAAALLRRVIESRKSKLFLDDGRFPLDLVLDLWDGRPIDVGLDAAHVKCSTATR